MTSRTRAVSVESPRTVPNKDSRRPAAAISQSSVATWARFVPFLAALPVCLGGFPQIARAQDQAPLAATKPGRTGEYPTLAAALAEAAPSGAGIAISVGANRIKLPPDNESVGLPRLAAGATPRRIAQRFGLMTRTFGSVTALAPTTMVVINTRPEKPNIYIGMPPDDVLTLLLGTLTDSQWQSITSAQGLAVSALTTQDQDMLVRALLPDGKLTVAPWYYNSRIDYKKEDVRDLSRSLPQSRLRLSQSFAVGFPAEDGTGSYQSDDIPPPPDNSPRYSLTDRRDYGGSKESLYGVTVRETVPNREKPGQLPFTDARLSRAVPLADLLAMKTVGELIRNIATLAGIELYADPRYAVLSLSTVGASGATASARDLLRAVAFGATATYRRVGSATEPRPAFVLTDDLVGMGTRQSLWYEFERDGDALRAGPVSGAAQSLYTRFGPRSVKPYGDDAALAASDSRPDAGTTEEASSTPGNPDYLPSTRKPFQNLTPAQQEAILRVIEQHNSVYKSQPASTKGNIDLYPQVRLELLVPTLSAPLDMKLNVGQGVLFRVPPGLEAERRAARQAEQQKLMKEYLAKHPEARTTEPPVSPSAKNAPLLPRRAVLLSPRTVGEVDDAVAAMKKLDLNELWLDIPFGSTAPGAAESPSPTADTETILEAAIRATEKTGIRVYPVVSPFAEEEQPIVPATLPSSEGKPVPTLSGALPSKAARDKNFLGETSADAERHIQERRRLFAADAQVIHLGQDNERPTPPVYRNPLAAGVLPAAEAHIRRLAGKPGVAGMVWKETDPPGYDLIRGGDDMSRRLLGYQDDMRLAFLRHFGADPVDLYTPNYYSGKADTTVPIQDRGEYLVGEKYQAWKQFRRDQNLVFLRALRTAAGTAPVLVKQRRSELDGFPDWYMSWDDPKAVLPTHFRPGDDFDLGNPKSSAQSNSGSSVQTPNPSQSFLEALSLPEFDYYRSHGQTPSASLQPGAKSRTIGFVLDLTVLPDAKRLGQVQVKVLSDFAKRANP